MDRAVFGARVVRQRLDLSLVAHVAGPRATAVIAGEFRQTFGTAPRYDDARAFVEEAPGNRLAHVARARCA
jgi:hypothetical protein